ncbi:MAG: arabinose 5-phosphate isomerase [Betaproteobacteria bacterium]|nr:arabinose 5-phosphate isomerase [Betaproteobacteria bacterium]
MIAAASQNPQAATPQNCPDKPDAQARESGPLALAREVLRTEAEAITGLIERIDASFAEAVELLLASRGRVVVSGMGKSGHIARKIAATFASTGTAAFFVHPAEASHGDLGMITADDVLVAFSNSGETGELLAIVPSVKRMGAKLVALTGNPDSTLARLADVHLNIHVEREACPMGLAPTASTTAQLAMGDALAVALLDARGFGPADFARSHPGGSLGRQSLLHVRDVMRTGDAIPMVPLSATLAEALREVTAKRMGMTAIVDQGRVCGVFTDGDLRRALQQVTDMNTPVASVMTASPRSIVSSALAIEAVHLMDQHNITQLLVIDGGKLVGALNAHDLLHAKVV